VRQTAKKIAAIKDRIDVVRYLLSYDLNFINIEDEWGNLTAHLSRVLAGDPSFLSVLGAVPGIVSAYAFT